MNVDSSTNQISGLKKPNIEFTTPTLDQNKSSMFLQNKDDIHKGFFMTKRKILRVDSA